MIDDSERRGTGGIKLNGCATVVTDSFRFAGFVCIAP